jgi:VanZ family protein
MGLVLAMSSAALSAENTGGVISPLLTWALPWLRPEDIKLLHGIVRKIAHVTEYGVLGVLWRRSLVRSGTLAPGPGSWAALGISVACAAVDETHQAFLASRTGSAADVLLDSLGALTGILLAGVGWRRVVEATTTVLLWIAAVGGLGGLALGLAAGGSGGVLWLSVPAAAALLVYRRRRSASRN